MQAMQTRHRLNVKDFHRMAEAGILSEDDRIELIEGELFDMSPIGALHCGTTKKLNHWLSTNIGGKAIVSVQDALVLSDTSELYPDIAVLRWQDDFYTNAHPCGADVLLLIEVADSTATTDRHHKMPLYARYGVVESWLIDVQKQQIEIYRQPHAEGYQECYLLPTHEAIAPQQLPDLWFRACLLW